MAFVKKPDNSVAGPFNMVEMPAPFLGNYYADFYTALSDPEGEYLELTVSPIEMIKSSKKFGMYLPASGNAASLNSAIASLSTEVASLGSDITNLHADVMSLNTTVSTLAADIDAISGATTTLQNVSKSLVSMVVPSAIKGIIPFSQIKANLFINQSIIGVVSDEDLVGGNL